MGHTIQETTVTVFIGNSIRRVNVIKGSLYSRVYSIGHRLIHKHILSWRVLSIPLSPSLPPSRAVWKKYLPKRGERVWRFGANCAGGFRNLVTRPEV